MRGLPNKEPLNFEFKAEVPTEVPDFVAEYYTNKKNYAGKFFRYANDPKPQEPEEPQDDLLSKEEKFDPKEWITSNYRTIKDSLTELKWNEVQAVAKLLKIKPFGITRERLEEKIVHDFEVKEKQQEELAKHEGIKDE